MILFLFSPEGLIKAKAKGVLKPSAKLKKITELFDWVEWELVKGRAGWILVGGKVIGRPQYLRRDFLKTLCLTAFAEAVIKIAPDKERYALVFEFWRGLRERKREELKAYLVWGILSLLYAEGFLRVDPAKEKLLAQFGQETVKKLGPQAERILQKVNQKIFEGRWQAQKLFLESL